MAEWKRYFVGYKILLLMTGWNLVLEQARVLRLRLDLLRTTVLVLPTQTIDSLAGLPVDRHSLQLQKSTYDYLTFHERSLLSHLYFLTSLS